MSSSDDKVLIVDDDSYVRQILSHWLIEEGYRCEDAADGMYALEKLAQDEFALMLLDMEMPRLTGMEVLSLTRVRYPHLAVVMVTGVDDRITAIKALKLGAFGYVVKPFDRTEVAIHVADALERRRLVLEAERYRNRMEELVQDRTAKLKSREEELAWRLVWAAERRDQDTGVHIRCIGLFSEALAKALGWSGEICRDLRMAAAMHDIGKIGVPDSLLLKPGRFSQEEHEMMQIHTEIGASILANSEIPMLQMAHDVALYHHERWDGKGYPTGIGGESIPISARIVAITDVYDSLTSKRVYKGSMGIPEALETMKKMFGAHFDSGLETPFLEAQTSFEDIREDVKARLIFCPEI